MVQINFAQKSVTVKIVYYGPGMSGKTTNLEIVHQRAPESNKGDLTSISTDGDRTLFFDFMPLDLGTVAGMRTQFQLYTVPGQVYYNSTRKLVLQGVDGVIFIADSSGSMMDENLESLRNLEENLREYGKDISTIPMVIQYNKRDLPDALSVEELEAKINRYGAPSFEGIASSGQGVFPTLKSLAASVLDTIHEQTGAASAGRPATAPAAVQPAAPLPAPAAAAPAPQQPPAVPAMAGQGQQSAAAQGTPPVDVPTAMNTPPRAPTGVADTRKSYAGPVLAAPHGPASIPAVARLALVLHGTWGTDQVVGLSALRVFAADGQEVLPADVDLVVPPGAAPEALQPNPDFPIAALFDGDAETAWFSRFVEGMRLELTFEAPTQVASLCVANAAVLDVACGARGCSLVLVDAAGAPSAPYPVELRQAPPNLSTLLFQTVDVVATASGGSVLAASMTERALVGIKRHNQAQLPWPAWYAPVAPSTLPLLPMGYVYSLQVSTATAIPAPVVSGDEPCAADTGAEPRPTTLFSVQFRGVDNADPLNGAICAEPADAVMLPATVQPSAGPLSFCMAFETVRCVVGVEIDVSTPAEIAIAVDNVAVFTHAVPMNAEGRATLFVPFVKDESLLARFQQSLVRVDPDEAAL